MKSKKRVLRSTRYDEAAIIRAADPVVIEMYDELVDAGVKPSELADDWSFVRQANREHQRRGGAGTFSIGEVVDALIIIENEGTE